jgi:hypothetical protein
MKLWPLYFGLTFFVELVAMMLVTRREDISMRQLFVRVLAANLLTHPLAFWFATRELPGLLKTQVLLIAELTLIPLVEGALYARTTCLSKKEAIGASYVANAVSIVVGLITLVVAQ